MYRNCVYNNSTKSIHLWTWDANGERVKQELPYRPYIYLEDKDGDATSIYGNKLKKKEFNTEWDRRKFVKESGIKKIYENIPPYQQFLIDNNYYHNDSDDFSKYPLKIMFLDIECPSDPNIDEGAFPDSWNPLQVINLLTCYDTETKRYTVFGLNPHNTKRTNVDYIHCQTEKQLLMKFVKYFSSNYPDVLTTYNGADFDIPYTVNRITELLGKEWADRLSPIGRIYEKLNRDGKFGAPTREYVIEGISCLDYFVLYKKFSMEKRETYKLDYIAEVELEENKVEYEDSLWDLSKNDWDTYVEYNIVDVELLVKLDAKLNYIDLLRFLSYLGLCNMENAIKTLPLINGAVAVQARKRDTKIPTFNRGFSDEKIPGGFVGEPITGFSSNIVSFDANSLYPSVMISCNMSPETKLGRLEKDGEEYKMHHVSGKTYTLTKENMNTYLKSEDAAISKSNIVFSQKKVGLMPEFLDSLYAKRKIEKAKMLKKEKELNAKKKSLSEDEIRALEYEIQKYDTIQYAYKITLNSTYGYCANKYAPLGDLEIGASVTLTGQAVIKKSNDLFKQFVIEKYPEIGQFNGEALIYNDTDSCYLTFDAFEKVGISLKDENGKVSKKFYDLCDEFENYLNDNMTLWAKKRLLSKDPRLVFKREGICDSGIFISGKCYVLHLLDKEGIQMDKFKYTGVDVVKTTIPIAIKPYIKCIIECMLTYRDKEKTNKMFMEAYEKYKSLGPNRVYKNSSINKYEDYKKKCHGFTTVKGMQSHLKAAYYHDLIVDDMGLKSKYEKFKSGDKVKILTLKKPNKYNIDVIGFKGKFPKEFEEAFKVDYEELFDKIMYRPINRFYKVVNWKLRKPNENLKVELEDFFSEED